MECARIYGLLPALTVRGPDRRLVARTHGLWPAQMAYGPDTWPGSDRWPVDGQMACGPDRWPVARTHMACGPDRWPGGRIAAPGHVAIFLTAAAL